MTMMDVDPLTELENHRRFKERLQTQTVSRAAKSESFSVLLVDIDDFDKFNREKGHIRGDDVLKLIAVTLRETCPEYATVARYGGEEFAVLLPKHSLDEAVSFADWLRSRIKQVLAETSGTGLTVSVGCAQHGPATKDPMALMLAAELALSRAKHLGKNQVCRFDHIPGADANADPFELHKFLQDASLSTIQALAAAVDAKDPYTQGHSQRVAQFAADLARATGSSQGEIDLVYRTGTLHDVGKIGVPDEILKKPGPLTEEERAIMETHPLLGEVIVRKAPALEDTLPGVRGHHERWDGKGYPDGLRGDHIHKIARLLAIADTFDAMTSDRPYRKGMEVEVALNIIEENAGVQFDPELALAFVRMMRSNVQQKAA